MSSIVGDVISDLLTYAYLGKNKKDGYLLSTNQFPVTLQIEL
jgi:hypothetical protein